MFEVETCCYGFSVQTGTLILLGLSLIGDITYIWYSWSGLCALHEDHKGAIVDLAILLYTLMDCIIGFVISILGIVGIAMDVVGLLTPYLYQKGCFIAFLLLLVISLIISPNSIFIALSGIKRRFMLSEEIKEGSIIIVLAIFGLFIVLEVYFFIVIRSCRNSMKQDREQDY